MKNWIKNIFLLIFIVVTMIGCDPENVIEQETVKGKTEMASDYVWDDTNVKTITFAGTSITTNSSNVTISGSTATITAAGYYLISGSLTDGQLIVDAPKAKLKIMLDNVSIANSTTAPFYIKDATKVIVFLKSGTANTLSDATTYTNTDEPNAAVCSNAYLGFTGDGSLTVKGNYNDGISCDDRIVINNGTLNVSAIDDAIRAKDYLLIHNGNINASGVTGHALKADSIGTLGKGFVRIDGGTFNLVSSLADGIHAYKRILIEGGTFTINSEESQALKSDSLVLISGGTINIANTKTGIECPHISFTGGKTTLSTTKMAIVASFGTSPISADSSSLDISGGDVYVSSLSNSLVSDGNIAISGGTTVIQGPSSTSKVMAKYLGTFTISNGTFIGCGPNAGTSIKGFSGSSTQNSIKMTSSSIGVNMINIQDASGTSLATFKPARSSYYIVFSSPLLTLAKTYSVFTGGSYSGGSSTNGYYNDGTYTSGTQKTTFTPANTITEISF